MLIISQHARLLHLSFPRKTVYRVNAAWFKDKNELFSLLKKIRNDVFLDFPKDRLKPPTPVLTFGDLLEAMEKFKKIKYFAISNVSGAKDIRKIRRDIPPRISLVPKIESKKSIDNLETILTALKENERYLMLDKEDLYVDLGSRNKSFQRYIEKIRGKCRRNKFRLLELQGVIFSESIE